jgi:mono/diheme cytochrome c family protein
MRLRSTILMTGAAMILAGCNFTLAADITPPPDYVPPTPMPTLGPLYPAAAPNIQEGAAIFAEKCAPCHGEKGLGDGPQSMQLPVTVPGIGLADVARSAVPAAWFKTVTQGNLDRFMPPFVGTLSDQQRWDVVAYALTLHTTPEELSKGEALVDSGCAACRASLADQEKMAAISEDELVDTIRNGNAEIPPFGKDLSDEDAHAVAAYLRSLTFVAAPEVAAVTPAIAETPSAGVTLEPGTGVAGSPTTSAPGLGEVNGTVALPADARASDLTVTLRGYDHAPDQTSGPQEVLTLATDIRPDGSFSFDDVGMPVNRIFLAEVVYDGVTYRSAFAAAQADSTSIELPELKAYDSSTDISLLQLDQVHIYTDFGTAGSVQVLEIFAFSNNSDKSIIISTDGATIPFIQLPEGATNKGYEAGQDSASFVAANDGLAVVPSDKPYSIIAFFNMAYDKSLEIKQPLAIDTPSLLVLVPDGVGVQGSQLDSRGLQVIQNNSYQEYSASDLKAGDTLAFTVSGSPKQTSAAALNAHQGLLIGASFFGAALIGVGLYLYVRERRRTEAEEPESEFDSSDEVMDAILALDDLHRAGKISDEAYQSRRAELKEILREIA